LAETLVLIPGLLCDAIIWKHQVAALGERYDILIPDLTRFASIEAMAASVLNKTSAQLSVAGHSMGARVAMEMARMAPERVERLALLDTGIHPMRAGEPEKRAHLVELGQREGMRAAADAWLPPMVAPGALDADPSLRSDLYAMVERMNPAIHQAQITALLTRPDARQVLPLLRCPVLVGVGELDAWSPPAQHLDIVDVVPQATYVVFAGSGHMAPLEAPEAVSQALSEWMLTPLSKEHAHE
jgi:pimeloyl-ACP methyl ester carboxylesterase